MSSFLQQSSWASVVMTLHLSSKCSKKALYGFFFFLFPRFSLWPLPCMMKGHYFKNPLKPVSLLFRKSNWRQRKQACFPLMTKKVFVAQTWDFDSPLHHHPLRDILACSLFIILVFFIRRAATCAGKSSSGRLWENIYTTLCCSLQMLLHRMLSVKVAWWEHASVFVFPAGDGCSGH